MPIRVSNTVEKNALVVQLGSPIIVADSVSKDVLASVTIDGNEYVGRYIQNVGAHDLYYAIGQDCTPLSFDGILAASGTLNANGHGSGQQFDASNVSGRISVYSIGGTVVGVTLIKRDDLVAGNRNVL